MHKDAYDIASFIATEFRRFAPFGDVNGGTSREVINAYLVSRGEKPVSIPNKSEYIAALKAGRLAFATYLKEKAKPI